MSTIYRWVTMPKLEGARVDERLPELNIDHRVVLRKDIRGLPHINVKWYHRHSLKQTKEKAWWSRGNTYSTSTRVALSNFYERKMRWNPDSSRRTFLIEGCTLMYDALSEMRLLKVLVQTSPFSNVYLFMPSAFSNWNMFSREGLSTWLKGLYDRIVKC